MAIKKYTVKASAEAKAVVASKGNYISAAQFADTLKSAKKKFNEKFKKGPYACAEYQGMGYIYYNDGSRIFVPSVCKTYDEALAKVKQLNAKSSGKVAASKKFTAKASKSVKAAATLVGENDMEIVLRDDDGAELRVVKHPTVSGYRLRRTLNSGDGSKFQWDLSKEIYDTAEEAKQAALEGKATFHFKGRETIPSKPVQSSANSKTTKKQFGIKASKSAKKRKAIKASGIQDDIVMYFNGDNVYQGSVYDLADAVENLCYDDEVNAKFQEWCNQFGDPFDFDGSPIDTARVFTDIIIHEVEEAPETENGGSQFYEDGNGILDFEIFYANEGIYSAKSIKAGINAPDTDGPLCVCEHCLQGIESHEGRQVIYNEISEFDIEPEDRLICDWCEEESDILYQISPDEVNSAKSIKCAQGDTVYYQITDHYYNVIDVANSEEEAKAKAVEYLKTADDETVDIYYIDESNAVDDYIDTVYKEDAMGGTAFTVSWFYDDKFRDLAGSEVVYDLTSAEDIAHEHLDEFCVSIEYPGVDTLYINPDIYWDSFDGEFACTDAIAKWQDEVWKSMGIDASKSIKCGMSLNLNAKPNYTDWVLRGYKFDGEDVTTLRIDFQDDVKKAVMDMFSDPDIETVDLYKIPTEQETTGVFEDEEYFSTITRDDINASTNIIAALDKKSDVNDEEYNQALAEEVADRLIAEGYSDITFTVAPEAISFFINDEVMFVQPTDMITPNMADIYDDSTELTNAVMEVLSDKMWQQYDEENQAMRSAWENPDIDDPDYATRAVELSRDINCAEETVDIDDLEYITGEEDEPAEDWGYGFDSNGDPIDESTVEELERIAQEILDKSEIHNVDEYADLHNFNYYASIPYIQESFDISFTYVADIYELSKNGMATDEGIYTTVAPYNVRFNVRCKNGEVEYAECTDIDVNDGYVKDIELKNFNLDALVQFATDLVNPVAKDIYNGTTNF